MPDTEITVTFIDHDPPAIAGRGLLSWYPSVVEKLKAEPGTWAVLDKTWKSTGSAGSAAKKLKDYGCEAVQRQGVVYVRWPN